MSKKWVVDFNQSETVDVDFKRKNIIYPNLTFGVNGPIIRSEHLHRNSGILFQSDGKWTMDLQEVYKKACMRLIILRMLKY